MSGLRSVLLLCWRDTGHPQGGGSETYLQRIGAQLAASGVDVTLRTARYPGAPRREVVDGVQISRSGGRYSVYIWALLAMAAARLGLGPLRRVRPDVVVDTQNGLPFLARLLYGRRVAVLVHHCHREQWPVAGPVSQPARLVCRVVVVAAVAPAQPVPDGVAAVGARPGRPGRGQRANRRGAQRPRRGAGAASLCGPRSAAPRVVVLSRLVPHKQIEDALEAVAELRPRCPICISTSSAAAGGGSGSSTRCAAARHQRRGDLPRPCRRRDQTPCAAKAWVHVLPSRKEGWGLAVIEAAQHAVPTIGYRSSGGLSDSIIDGVTGMLVDDRAELVDRLEQLLADPVLRDQLGVKAQTRSGEFSWTQSADAMRTVLEVVARRRTSSAAWSNRTPGAGLRRPTHRSPPRSASPATPGAR